VKRSHVIVKPPIWVERGYTEANGTMVLKGPMEAKEPSKWVHRWKAQVFQLRQNAVDII